MSASETVLTEEVIRHGEDLLFRFLCGERLDDTDMRFGVMCQHARQWKLAHHRNPTIAEARAEMADADLVLTVYGTTEDGIRAAAAWGIKVEAIIEVPNVGVVIMRALSGIHPHVVRGQCYGWQKSENEPTPGALAHFETVRAAVARRPEMAEVIAAARLHG